MLSSTQAAIVWIANCAHGGLTNLNKQTLQHVKYCSRCNVVLVYTSSSYDPWQTWSVKRVVLPIALSINQFHESAEFHVADVILRARSMVCLEPLASWNDFAQRSVQCRQLAQSALLHVFCSNSSHIRSDVMLFVSFLLYLLGWLFISKCTPYFAGITHVLLATCQPNSVSKVLPGTSGTAAVTDQLCSILTYMPQSATAATCIKQFST